MTDSPPPRRVSLTKLQRKTAVAIDLLDLCQAITEDGHLDETEIEALRGWLAENRGGGLPAIEFLSATVERILADGRVTPDEHRELYQAIEAVFPPDLRKAVRGTRVAVEQAEREREWQAKRDSKLAAVAQQVQERLDFMVAGISHEGRHLVVEVHVVTRGERRVVLRREPQNPYSRNAIAIHLPNGLQIGYVPEALARDVAPILDAGYQPRARIKKVLQASRYPIPVVVADLYAPGEPAPAEIPDLEDWVPEESSEQPTDFERAAPAVPATAGLGRVAWLVFLLTLVLAGIAGLLLAAVRVTR